MKIFKYIFLVISTICFTDVSAQFGPPIAFDNLGYQGPMEVGDLNNDGLPDVVVSIKSASLPSTYFLAWYKNLGNGNFSSFKDIDGYFRFSQIGLGDFNNDGYEDIVGYNTDDYTFYWFENLKTDSFGSRQSILTINSMLQLDIGNISFKIADMNNDNTPDIIYGDDNEGTQHYISVIVPNNNAATWSSYLVTSTSMTGDIAVGDISGDGYRDVLGYSNKRFTASIGWFGWFKSNSSLGYSSKKVIQQGTVGGTVEVGDLDMDGDNDLAVRIENGPMEWWENDSVGNFTKHSLSGNFSWGDIVIEDINNDSKPDIVYHAVWWFENLGGGNFAPVQRIWASQGAGLTQVRLADIDSDGDLDFVYTSVSNHEVGYMLNYLSDDFKYSGRVFFDFNQNKIFDSNDTGFENIKLHIQPDTAAAFSNKGAYSFITAPGSHTISFDSLPNWHLTTDSQTYTRTVNPSNFTADSLDFGFYWDAAVTNFSGDLIGSFSRCNRVVNYWIDLRNLGTTRPSGLIKLELDDSLSYFSSKLSPDSNIGNTYYWHYDSLNFFGKKRINLLVKMPSAVSAGDTVFSKLTITEIENGTPVFTTRDSISQVISCSFDPNNKLSLTGLGEQGYVEKNSYLEYIVNFQNTGNDTAFYVRIEDQLDTNLNYSTFQPLFASHDNLSVQIFQDGMLTYIFDPIILPDSNVNEPESHGTIKFRIKMKEDLPTGTEISNTAAIFFDQNPEINTDTVLNTIYDCAENPGFNINSTVFCEGDTLLAVADGYFEDPTFNWSIGSFFQMNDSVLYWEADTTGTFALNLNVSNSFCDVDSFISFEINPAFQIADTIDICSGDSIYVGGAYQSTPGVYYDNLQSSYGCDSITSSTLILNPDYNSSFSEEICQGDSIKLGGKYRYNAGLYVDSLQSVNFCDSVVTTSLNINSVYSFNQTFSVCQDDSLLIYGVYRSNPGVYYDSLSTQKGCDSVYTASLSIDPKYRYHNDSEVCNGDSALIFGAYRLQQGIYYDSLQSSNGCDSIYSEFLFIRDEYDVALPSVDFCPGDSVEIFGVFQNSPGVYYDTLNSFFGCDSVIHTELIRLSVDTQITLTQKTFEVSEEIDSVIWINCSPINVVEGETEATFTPSENGSYAAVVYQNGCRDTTSCLTISIIAISENNFSDNVVLYPNPTNGKITVDLGGQYQDIKITLLSANGQLVSERQFKNQRIAKLNYESFAGGYYVVRVVADNQQAIFKITIQE